MGTASQVGPLIGPADGKLLHALTTLEAGQQWVVEPEPLDASGVLWKPGIREGVQPGSEFHLTEYFGPVLGIMTAADLDEAIELVNRIDYGLTSGLHSLDEDEINTWAERVQAGNLYVNRHITGAIVQRQPFGGWKRASVGSGAKAGGPNYLIGLGSWRDAPGEVEHMAADPIAERALTAAASAAAAESEIGWLREALGSDALAWEQEFGLTRDVTGLGVESNLLRYRPLPVTIRAETATQSQLLRIAAAGIRAGAPLTVSTPEPLHDSIQRYLDSCAVVTHVESAEQWLERAKQLAVTGGRVRLIGKSAGELADAVAGSPALAVYAGEVVSAGRVELLTFLREQAVSITTHRFGTPLSYRITNAA